MTAYIALLRAVNVGGTGKLPMSELKAICERAGFEQVKTYIASGNVVFVSALSEAEVKRALGDGLAAYAGKPVSVLVRTHAEMAGVLAAHAFEEREPAKTMAIFLDAKPPAKVDGVKGQADEQIATGAREIYVYYPGGVGRSKLRIAAAEGGTARNMNTVAKLVEMASCLAV